MAPDQPDPLDPRSEARVRRLLAEARHDEPIPAEVAARLDQVLAGLAAEPSEQADVVELHRRRRRVSQLLVAAAAVVAVGLGAQQVLQESTGGSGADAGYRGDAPAAEDAAPDSPPNGLASSPGAFDATSGSGAARSPRVELRVRPHEFATDVRHARKVAYGARAVSQADTGALSEEMKDRGIAGCRTTAEGPGRRVRVVYGGRGGVLVFRRTVADSQVVDLYLCGYDDVVRSITLPHS